MLREEIIRKFSDYEKKHPVDDYVCADWNCWPILRIITSNQYRYDENEYLGLGVGLVNRIKKTLVDTPYLGPVLYDLYSSKRAKRRAEEVSVRKADLESTLKQDPCHSVAPDSPGSDVVILTQSGRRTRLGDALFDIYSDPLAQYLSERDHSTMVWEQGPEIWPRYASSAWITKQLSLEIADVKNPLQINPPGWFKEYTSWSIKEFNYKLDWPQFRRIVHMINASSAVFSRWLDASGAKLLISVCWYSPLVMAATLAAKRMGIITVDLQHGIQGDVHLAYSGWEHMPANSYETIPDYFWSWGSSDAKNLMVGNPTFQSQCKVVVGGNLWYNMWREKDDLQAANLNALLGGLSHEKVILVTLQHGTSSFSEFICEVIKDSPADWQWLVRLHPSTELGEKEDIVKALDAVDRDNIDHDMSTHAPLYSLLGVCDIHITGHSTCALEALGFGVPTITVTDSGESAYRGYIKNGVVLSAKTVNKMRDAIESASAISKDKCRESVGNVFASAEQSHKGIGELLTAAKIKAKTDSG